MSYRLSIKITLCIFVLGVSSSSYADCNIPVADVTCLPGTLGYTQTQQEQQQAQENMKKFMEENDEAADRHNQNDPNSRYYLGTPAQQCEAPKQTWACRAGIVCYPPPADLDCAAISRQSARHHHHHDR